MLFVEINEFPVIEVGQVVAHFNEEGLFVFQQVFRVFYPARVAQFRLLDVVRYLDSEFLPVPEIIHHLFLQMADEQNNILEALFPEMVDSVFENGLSPQQKHGFWN